MKFVQHFGKCVKNPANCVGVCERGRERGGAGDRAQGQWTRVFPTDRNILYRELQPRQSVLGCVLLMLLHRDRILFKVSWTIEVSQLVIRSLIKNAPADACNGSYCALRLAG